MKSEKSETLKPNLINILILIYKFRVLNRNQIQNILNHKYRSRIITWLNYLTEEKYLIRKYSKEFAGIPAEYCLATKSRSELKKQNEIKATLLDRIYKEKSLSETFRKHSMFLADIYLSLIAVTKKNKVKLNYYTQTDLVGIKYLILPIPDAYFSIKENKKLTKRYFLDVFDQRDPRLAYRKRLKQYSNYFANRYWQDNTDKSFPEIIMVVPDIVMRKYLNRKIKQLLNGEGQEILFYLSTWDEIKSQGIKREVLHKVEIE